MKNLTLLLFWSMALSLLLISCNKDEIPNTTYQDASSEILVDPPLDLITASVFGQVIDEDGNPISEATIMINNVKYTTNIQGLYSAKNISINSYGNLVTIQKTGYFSGAKLIQTEEGRNANLNVTLLSKTLSGSVMSSDGGKVIIDGKSSVTLEANGIRDSNGNLYSGEVNVFAKWLDPSKLSTLQAMPGDLRAVNSNSEIMQLATYGMLAVELESPSGLALNIADGNTAELIFDLPTSMVADAPSAIPLWYFDETTGYWIEDGEATLIDGVYVGEVSHFSFWNCDDPFPLVNASGTIVNPEGDGIGNIRVEIAFPSGVSSGYAITDNRGFFAGKIPQDEILIISVYNQCDQLVYSNTIGPFSADVIIQPIIIDIAENIITFTGTLLDCDGLPIPNGYVSIEFDDLYQYISTNSDGTFESSVDVCNTATTITATGYNFDDFQQSLPAQYSITDAIDLGVISTCDDLESYFYYEMDGVLYIMESQYAQISANSTGPNIDIVLSGSNPIIDGFTTLELLSTDGPGTYDFGYALFFTENNNSNGLGSCDLEECNTLILTFEDLGYEYGDAVKAEFSGTITLWTPSGTGTEEEVTISGAFKGKINL